MSSTGCTSLCISQMKNLTRFVTIRDQRQWTDFLVTCVETILFRISLHLKLISFMGWRLKTTSQAHFPLFCLGGGGDIKPGHDYSFHQHAMSNSYISASYVHLFQVFSCFKQSSINNCLLMCTKLIATDSGWDLGQVISSTSQSLL